MTGLGLEIDLSKLRIARGVLIAVAKRAGHSLTELQSVICRDIRFYQGCPLMQKPTRGDAVSCLTESLTPNSCK